MVSIIIPYNKDRGYLSQCVDSVKNQTYKDIELILSKGDNVWPVNFNNGLKKAKGEFVKFIHEDDWLLVDGVEKLVKGIGDAPWAYAGAVEYRLSTEERTIYIPPETNLADMLDKNKVHAGATLYRTDILKAVGGMNESLWTGEEYELNLRLMSKGYMPNLVKAPVYVYRHWTGQKTFKYRRASRTRKERANEIERIRDLYR